MKTRLHFCSNAASIRILLLLLLFGLCPTHTDWFIQQMFWHRLFDLLNFCQLLSTPIWPLMILLTLFIDMQAGEISARTVACISIRNAITTYHQFGTWQSLYINSIINYSEIALYMPGIRWGQAPMKTRGTWTVSHTEKRKRWSNWDQVPLGLLGLHLISIEKLHN